MFPGRSLVWCCYKKNNDKIWLQWTFQTAKKLHFTYSEQLPRTKQGQAKSSWPFASWSPPLSVGSFRYELSNFAHHRKCSRTRHYLHHHSCHCWVLPHLWYPYIVSRFSVRMCCIWKVNFLLVVCCCNTRKAQTTGDKSLVWSYILWPIKMILVLTLQTPWAVPSLALRCCLEFRQRLLPHFNYTAVFTTPCPAFVLFCPFHVPSCPVLSSQGTTLRSWKKLDSSVTLDFVLYILLLTLNLYLQSVFCLYFSLPS